MAKIVARRSEHSDFFYNSRLQSRLLLFSKQAQRFCDLRLFLREIRSGEGRNANRAAARESVIKAAGVKN